MVTRLKVLVHTAEDTSANNVVVTMVRITVAFYHLCDVSGLGIFKENVLVLSAGGREKHNLIAHVMVCHGKANRETVVRVPRT